MQWIILLVGLLFVAWIIYGRLLLNKIVWIKNIISSALQSTGDIKVDGDIIQVKFLWSVKTFSFEQITEIKAYMETNWGLEEYDQVDVLFENGNKICFRGLPREHQNVVQLITSSVGIQNKVWAWGFLPRLGDSMKRDIVFDKTNNRR